MPARLGAGSDRPRTAHVLVWAGSVQRHAVCTTGANKAILCTGDRCDARRLTVTATLAAADGWLHIACALGLSDMPTLTGAQALVRLLQAEEVAAAYAPWWWPVAAWLRAAPRPISPI